MILGVAGAAIFFGGALVYAKDALAAKPLLRVKREGLWLCAEKPPVS